MFYRMCGIAICLVFISLSFGCSFLNQKEVSQSKIDKLHQQIRSKDFKQIYADSSENLRSRLSKTEFSNLMNQAIEKMKKVDETISFQESSLNEILPQMLDNEGWASFKFEKLEKNDKKIEFYSQCGKAEKTGDFKLVALVILEPVENDKPKIFYI